MSIHDMPNFRLSAASPAARGFLRRRLTDYHRGIRYVQDLKSTLGAWRKDDYRRVLPHGGGSDAAKHALLAAVAREHNAPVQLVFGIYELDRLNTPAASSVLSAAGLESVLDADCFLVYEGRVLDLARQRPQAESLRFLHTETIRPEDLTEYRLAVFQRYLWDWSHTRNVDMARAWEIRQRCIEARSTL
jgi:hypothetical protein